MYAHVDVTEHCAIPDYSKVYVKEEREERAGGEAAVEVKLCEVEGDIEVLGWDEGNKIYGVFVNEARFKGC